MKISDKLKVKKISHRLTYYVIFAIILVFACSIFYEWRSDIGIMRKDMEYKINYTSEMIALSISEPLWDYDYEAISKMGESFFKDKEVNTLIVKDKIAGEIYVNIVEEKNFIDESIIKKEEEVFYQGKKIGSIEIHFTNAFRKAAIYQRVTSRFIILLILTTTLSIVVMLITKRIMAPVEILKADVQRLADGKERISRNSFRDDEIGQLAINFNIMGEKIEKTKKELMLLNESLEEKIYERTEDLTEKNEELNQIVDTLKQTQEELLRASKLKLTTQLVSGVAHEINTPLGVTITLASHLDKQLEKLSETLLSRKATRGQVQKQIDDLLNNGNMIEENLRKVNVLVDQFKQLSFNDSYEQKTKFDLSIYINETVQSLAQVWMPERIKLNINCEDSIVINSYKESFLELFNHLIVNAIDHAFQEDEDGNIGIYCKLVANTIDIKVVDDGKGIAPRDLKNIFNPFYKTKLLSKGTGLGLAIVEHIVSTVLYGNIRCESELGTGTVFYIKIPIDKT